MFRSCFETRASRAPQHDGEGFRERPLGFLSREMKDRDKSSVISDVRSRYFLQRNSFHFPSPTPATSLNPERTKVAGAANGLWGTTRPLALKRII